MSAGIMAATGTCSCTTWKSVRTRSFSGPYFIAFGLNTERYEGSTVMPSVIPSKYRIKVPQTSEINQLLWNLMYFCIFLLMKTFTSKYLAFRNDFRYTLKYSLLIMAQQEHSLLNNYMLYQRSTPFFPRDKYMRVGYDFLNIHFHLLPLRKNFIKFFLNGNK